MFVMLHKRIKATVRTSQGMQSFNVWEGTYQAEQREDGIYIAVRQHLWTEAIWIPIWPGDDASHQGQRIFPTTTEEPVTTKAKAARPRKAVAKQTQPTAGEQLLPVASIEPHPDNPRKVFDQAELESLAESLKSTGLLQPIVVRPFGDGYQLLAGERRLRAARIAKWPEIRCTVLQVDDAKALEILMIENLERAELNPIEIGEGLWRLTQPIDEGGGGLTQSEAAAKFGHKQAWVSDLIALRDLPEWLRQGVISGEISRTCARLFVPYLEAPAVIDEVQNEFKMHGQTWNRGDFEDELANAVHRVTRPIELDDKPFWDWQVRQGDFGRLFKLTPAVEAELDIVEIPTFEGSAARRRRALNVKRFDELQEEAKQKIRNKRKDAPSVEASVDPAAEKEAAQEKRRRQREILQSRIDHWWTDWCRAVASEEILLRIEQKHGELWPAIEVLLHVATSNIGYRCGGLGNALRIVDGRTFQAFKFDTSDEKQENRLIEAACVLLDHKDFAADWSGHSQVLEGLTSALGIDHRERWAAAFREEGRERDLVRDFLELHTKDQLAKLGKIWKVPAEQLQGNKQRLVNALLPPLTAGKPPRPVPKELGRRMR